MKDLSKRISQIEARLYLDSTEGALEVILRRQANLIFYYSHTNAVQEDMNSFAKRNGNTPEQERDNLRIFARLVSERTNSRTIERTYYGSTI